MSLNDCRICNRKLQKRNQQCHLPEFWWLPFGWVSVSAFSDNRMLFDLFSDLPSLQRKDHIRGSFKEPDVLFPAHPTAAVLQADELLFHLPPAVWANFVACTHASPCTSVKRIKRQTGIYTLTFGFVYCPCVFVLSSYWMANFGQRCRHPRHITHLSLTQTGFLSRISIACTGHFFAHNPQPIQVSSTWKCEVLRTLLL